MVLVLQKDKVQMSKRPEMTFIGIIKSFFLIVILKIPHHFWPKFWFSGHSVQDNRIPLTALFCKTLLRILKSIRFDICTIDVHCTTNFFLGAQAIWLVIQGSFICFEFISGLFWVLSGLFWDLSGFVFGLWVIQARSGSGCFNSLIENVLKGFLSMVS